ncbi:hypothetical protein [Xanthomonas sp. 60]
MASSNTAAPMPLLPMDDSGAQSRRGVLHSIITAELSCTINTDISNPITSRGKA